MNKLKYILLLLLITKCSDTIVKSPPKPDYNIQLQYISYRTYTSYHSDYEPYEGKEGALIIYRIFNEESIPLHVSVEMGVYLAQDVDGNWFEYGAVLVENTQADIYTDIHLFNYPLGDHIEDNLIPAKESYYAFAFVEFDFVQVVTGYPYIKVSATE